MMKLHLFLTHGDRLGRGTRTGSGTGAVQIGSRTVSVHISLVRTSDGMLHCSGLTYFLRSWLIIALY